MNITFLIGNGFDINMQLKTAYKDFYNYYLNLEESSKDILANSIMKTPENWSDLELGLGEFLKEIDADKVEEFLDSKGRMEDELAKYLSSQDERVEILDEAQAAVEFKDKIVNFFQEFNAEEKDKYKEFWGETSAINYCFVTFNYTQVLDYFVYNCKQKISVFATHTNKLTTYQDKLFFPVHIHGTIKKNFILGLDSEDQIQNPEFKKRSDMVNLIKPFVNKQLGEKTMETVQKIIDQSRYICLYGLSMGATDQTWWKYILSWLKKDEKNRLVIYNYLPEKLPVSAHKRLRLRDNAREKFRKQSLCTQEDFSKIQDKIIVINNSRIFDFKNVKIIPETEELVGAL